jgi:hypothetical protein
MKRFFAALAVAAVAGATYAAAAPGGQRTVPTAKQFTALRQEVASLKQKVRQQGGTIKTLQSQVGTQATTLTTVQGQLTTVQTTATGDAAFIANCLEAAGTLGISQYGIPSEGSGYLGTNDNGSTLFLTTALDIDTSSSPSGYFQLVEPGCVSAGPAIHKGGVSFEGRHSLAVKQR